MGAAYAAPHLEWKGRGGSCCPIRNKKKNRGQHTLPSFEMEMYEKRAGGSIHAPSCPLPFPLPLGPHSSGPSLHSPPPRSSTRQFRHLHPSRRGKAAVVTGQQPSLVVMWRPVVISSCDAGHVVVVCGGDVLWCACFGHEVASVGRLVVVSCGWCSLSAVTWRTELAVAVTWWSVTTSAPSLGPFGHSQGE